jgi:hypothetical protein
MYRNPILDHYERTFGIYMPGAVEFAEDGWNDDWRIAADAQPTLVTTPSAGIPSFLTTIVDPNILQVLTAKNKGADILGEVRKGDWTLETAMFPVVEHTGEVTSYGDFNNLGRANANMTFPQRQSYLYQTVIEYGELELDRAALSKVGWANELKMSAVTVLNKFQNLTYFKGVAGLQNYGIQTDPALPAPIAPSLKAWGGLGWWNGNIQAATPNEIYGDIQSLYNQLVVQSGGNISLETDELILALSPHSNAAITATNSFNVNLPDILRKSFPKIKIIDAVQYGAISAQNPQGIAAGELVQLIAPKVMGQDTGYCAFNEKLRTHPVIRDLSSFKQKMTQGTWGAVIRQPFAIAQMIGV